MTHHTLDLNTADLLASGDVKVQHFGGLFSYQLHRDDWRVYREAKRDGFMVMPRADYRYRRLSKVWWAWCEARNWPVVMVKPRVKFALVEADQIALPARLLPDDEILAPLRPFFAEHCVGGWSSVDSSFICASRVPIPLAPFVATRIADLLWAALNLPERTSQ